MEKGGEFLGCGHRRGDVVCPFIRVESRHYRHLVPGSGMPGVNRSLLDSVSVDSRLERPAYRGVIAVEDCKRSIGNCF